MYLYYAQLDKAKLSETGRAELNPDYSALMVKRMLKDYNHQKKLGLSEETIERLEMKIASHGKPYFDELLTGHLTSEPVHFNVSHSENWWSCILGDSAVGLDMEVCRPRRKYRELAKRFYSAEEYQYVLVNGPEAFLAVWVCKEAYIKFKGTGLSEGLSTFSAVGDGQLLDHIEKHYPEGKRIDACVKRMKIEQDLILAYCTKEDSKISKIIMHP